MTPVAIVFKNEPFLTETDAFKAYAFPVQYGDKEYIEGFLNRLFQRLDENLNP